jgi:hypothetical protein
MSSKAVELFEQLTGQLASDVADKMRMDIELGTFIKQEIDYHALAEKTMEFIDTEDLASDVLDRLDYTDIASNLDMSDLAREVSDELDLDDIADNLDVEKIARTIRNNHADELAIEVAAHLARSDLMLDTMGQIADDRIASVTDFLIPEARRAVLAADVADRLKQSDDMRDFIGEIARQLVRKEVRSLFIDLVKMMTSPEQWRGAPVQEGPVDLGEFTLSPAKAA